MKQLARHEADADDEMFLNREAASPFALARI